jgi:CubicO group peptidase (beta-lactamase class C family)
VSKKDSLVPFIIGFGLLALGLKALAASSGRSSSTSGRAPAGIPFDKIDGYIAGQMKRLNIPGAALAVVEGKRIVHVRGFGKARPGGEIPLPHTPFFIGSLTKSFTALAVMQLVEAGKVKLDDPIQRHLPWFRVADPLASAQMTVRHLLNQTSGLPALAGEMPLFDLDARPDATERQVRALSRLKLTHPVGEHCEYCNLNYLILGLIIETASGESYADYIQSHIFDPLGMKHSYASKAMAQNNGLAVGHRHWFSLPIPAPDLPVPLGSLPAGQLISCAEDMAHYLIAHMNDGVYGNAQILSAAGIAELHRGAKEYTAMGFSAGKYAMGWFETDMGNKKVYSHSGNVPDFSAHMAILPGQKRGLILLLNADPYGLPPITGELGTGVTALLAGQEPPPVRLEFIQWIMRLLPVIPLLQVAGVVTTLRRLHRWRAEPTLRPARLWGKHILLPLAPNLTLTGILIYLSATGLIRFMSFFMPDVAWIARISGSFAGVWTILRTGLFIRILHKSSRSPELDINA